MRIVVNARKWLVDSWKKLELEHSRPLCPNCGSSDVFRFPVGGSTFGDIHYTDHLPEKLAYRNIWSVLRVGSWRPPIICPPIEPEPKWHCENCGFNWGRVGG